MSRSIHYPPFHFQSHHMGEGRKPTFLLSCLCSTTSFGRRKLRSSHREGGEASSLTSSLTTQWQCYLVSRVWLCDPRDCSPPSYSVRGVLQARILEWVAVPFSRGSSWPRGWSPVSCIAGGFFTVWAIGKTLRSLLIWLSLSFFIHKTRWLPRWS